ncbi:MAG: lipopolysaccharide biosynthesis protein [Pseudomonadota bacterium]
MDEVRYYLAVFLRRLPYFLIVATAISASAVAVAVSLPPAYVSQMQLVVEAPQIPTELAASTVRTPALEQLQIVEQRLLTRANMLEIARVQGVFPDIENMVPDDIVRGMRARTTINKSSGRNAATLMRVSFEAHEPRIAAAVLNDYLSIIQEADVEFRRGRAGETLEFFAQETERLGLELTEQSARILAFKQENTDALPTSLEFRISKREEIRDALGQTNREITRLEDQRARFLDLFEETGRVALRPEAVLSPTEQQLRRLESELGQALLVFSEENPKVRLLRGRIALLEDEVADEAATTPLSANGAGADGEPPNVLALQIDEIDSEIELLSERRDDLLTELGRLTATIERTPEVSITLEELERTYALLETQYATAEQRFSTAQTGDLIESRSRGQRIAVIEQPNVPNSPSRPNRVMIAGGGLGFGIAAGLALVVLLEFVGSAIKRPEDLVSRFGISPLTTVPYIRTGQQVFVQRSLKLIMALAIIVGTPALIYAVHTYYLPIDLLAEKVANRLGIRW